MASMVDYKGTEKMAQGITQSQVDNLIAKYKGQEYVTYRVPNGRWKSARIQGVFQNFMVVKAGKVSTTILWKDILLGEVEVV